MTSLTCMADLLWFRSSHLDIDAVGGTFAAKFPARHCLAQPAVRIGKRCSIRLIRSMLVVGRIEVGSNVRNHAPVDVLDAPHAGERHAHVELLAEKLDRLGDAG